MKSLRPYLNSFCVSSRKTCKRWVVGLEKGEIYHHKAISRMSRKLIVGAVYVWKMSNEPLQHAWECHSIMILFGNFSASQVLFSFVILQHHIHGEMKWKFMFLLLPPLSHSSLELPLPACCQLAWAVNLFSIYLYSLFSFFLFILLLLSLLLPVSLFHSHTPVSIPSTSTLVSLSHSRK